MRLIDANALECKLRFENEDMSQAVVSEFDIAEAPTIDPVRHARWIMNSDHPDKLICNACGCKEDGWWADKGTNYCPACGCKMDGAT